MPTCRYGQHLALLSGTVLRQPALGEQLALLRLRLVLLNLHVTNTGVLVSASGEPTLFHPGDSYDHTAGVTSAARFPP